MNQCRQQDHRYADGPNYLHGAEESVVEIEQEPKANYGKLQHD